MTGSLSQPGEEWSFSAGSQAGFILTFGYADVHWAAAGLPAEWEWGRCAGQPHRQPRRLLPVGPPPHWVPHGLLFLQEGEQVKEEGEVGQKEGNL